jgi:anti-sigma B factor antagonist
VPPRPPVPFVIESRSGPDRCTICPRGELDIATVPQLEEALALAEQSSVGEVLVDLREVTFIDSMGVRCLLQATARSQGDSARLRVIRGSDQVELVLRIAGVADQIPFV